MKHKKYSGGENSFKKKDEKKDEKKAKKSPPGFTSPVFNQTPGENLRNEIYRKIIRGTWKKTSRAYSSMKKGLHNITSKTPKVRPESKSRSSRSRSSGSGN